MTRPNKNTYFMQMAHHAASRGTCPRRQVGCVLASHEGHVVSTGYNGSLSKTAHCTMVGCQMEDGHCVRTVHAEANAVAQAAWRGTSTRFTTAYTTTFPCRNCLKLLIQAGVVDVFFAESYPHPQEVQAAHDMAVAAGVGLLHLPI